VKLEEPPPAAPDDLPATDDVPASHLPATDDLPAAHVESALRAAYSYLSKRERTTVEIARRLQREAFSAETIAQTLAALHDEGTLDDHRFARLFTEDKRGLEQWGRERIRRALIQRGVDPETAAAALDAGGAEVADTAETEQERALSLLRHRFPRPPRSRRDRDRVLGVLLRKGYEPELAVETLSTYARE
jgi:regulatory protein